MDQTDIASSQIGNDMRSAEMAELDRLLTAGETKLAEREKPLTSGTVQMPEIPKASNVIDAAANGAKDGMLLAATDAEGKLVLVTPERPAVVGSKVK